MEMQKNSSISMEKFIKKWVWAKINKKWNHFHQLILLQWLQLRSNQILFQSSQLKVIQYMEEIL